MKSNKCNQKQRNIIICVLVSLVLLAGILLLIPKTKPANAGTIESNDNLNFTLDQVNYVHKLVGDIVDP